MSRQAAPLFQFAFFLFAYYAYVGAFTPYAGLWFAANGMGPGEVGILMSLMQVTRIFGPGLWAWVADHTERRVTVLRITALAALLIFGGLVAGRGFAAFFAVMLALNACTGAQAPLSDALILSELKGDFKRYGRLRLWGSVGFILAVSGGGRLLDVWGIMSMPWMCWALLALVLTASLWLQEKPHAQTHDAVPSIRTLLKKPEVISFFASTFLMVAAHA
ncbi:MAG TPA: MFS transporter, partial [Burkholderiaceae bacterium]